jgi:four helix bundle protein
MPEPKRDLEERTFQFAKSVLFCIRKIPVTIVNRELIRQVVRSSGSVGANYIEANESLGQKDFLMKLRISRKEAKETMFWLRLIRETNDVAREDLDSVFCEAEELKKILSSIINKRNSL